jgi:hypothetical protein
MKGFTAMKKLSVIFLILLFGCGPQLSYVPGTSSTYVIDFSKYSKQNFIITPDKYPGKYESIGMITVVFMPEAKKENKYVFDEFKMYQGEQKLWASQKIDMEKIPDNFHEKAVSMGANAVINFEIKPYSEMHRVSQTENVKIDGLEVSGFAIKRLGAFK